MVLTVSLTISYLSNQRSISADPCRQQGERVREEGQDASCKFKETRGQETREGQLQAASVIRPSGSVLGAWVSSLAEGSLR